MHVVLAPEAMDMRFESNMPSVCVSYPPSEGRALDISSFR